MPTEEQAVVEALVRDAFDVYEVVWTTKRAAVRDPANTELRERLAEMYGPTEQFDGLIAFLDERVEASTIVVEDPDAPDTLTLESGSLGSPDGALVIMTVCEVLRAKVVEAETGEVVYDQVDAYRVFVTMERFDGPWRLSRDFSTDEFPGSETCDE